MQAYRIVHWQRAHESYDTQRRVDGLAWIQSPTNHDSKGLKRIFRDEQGPAIYCAYVLMAQVSGKLPKCARGWLIDRSGRPLTAEDLADETNAPVSIFEVAHRVLSAPNVGWLELAELPSDLISELMTRRNTRYARSPGQSAAGLQQTCSRVAADMPSTGPDRTIPDRKKPDRSRTHTREDAPSGPGVPPEGSRITGAFAARSFCRTGPAPGEAHSGSSIPPECGRSAGRSSRTPPLDHVEGALARQPTLEHFVMAFTSQLAEACQLPAAEYNAQLAALRAVATRTYPCEHRAALGRQCVEIALSKKRYCDRKGGNVWALWQSEVNKLLQAHGLTDTANPGGIPCPRPTKKPLRT